MRWANVFNLGIKELRSLARDPMMLFLVAYSFTIAVYTAATAMPETLNRAPIAIVDEDRSPLSTRIVGAFYPPSFLARSIQSIGGGRRHLIRLGQHGMILNSVAAHGTESPPSDMQDHFSHQNAARPKCF